jgi:hypothetical protein
MSIEQSDLASVYVHRESNRELAPAKDLIQYLRLYAQEKPAVVALCCFGLGFVVGWKLKPW